MTHTSPFDDERISAYLDDELSPTERAAFEELLAKRDDYQHAVEELASLRQDLRSLPRETLKQPLAARVLELAERAMLTGDDGAADDMPIAPVADIDRARVVRRLAWPAIAVAAALLLWLLGPQFATSPKSPPRIAERLEKSPRPTEPEAEANEAAAPRGATGERGIAGDPPLEAPVLRDAISDEISPAVSTDAGGEDAFAGAGIARRQPAPAPSLGLDMNLAPATDGRWDAMVELSLPDAEAVESVQAIWKSLAIPCEPVQPAPSSGAAWPAATMGRAATPLNPQATDREDRFMTQVIEADPSQCAAAIAKLQSNRIGIELMASPPSPRAEEVRVLFGVPVDASPVAWTEMGQPPTTKDKDMREAVPGFDGTRAAGQAAAAKSATAAADSDTMSNLMTPAVDRPAGGRDGETQEMANRLRIQLRYRLPAPDAAPANGGRSSQVEPEAP